MQHNDEVPAAKSKQEWVLGIDLAKELDIGPPVLGNWRMRYSDFPPTKKSESGRFLYNRAEVIEWSKSRELVSPTKEKQISTVVKEFSRLLGEEEFVLTSLSMLSMIKLGIRLLEGTYLDRRFLESAGDIGRVLLRVSDLWAYQTVKLDPIWQQLIRIQKKEIPLWIKAIDNLPKSRFSQSTTVDSINELIVKLVVHRNTTVFDPAAGEGRTLLRVAEKIQGVAEGQELNSRALEILALRAFLIDVRVETELGDSLTDDKFHSKRYDVIVADPPMNLRLSDSARLKNWPFGQPGHSGDWAWAQHVVLHLVEGGEGYLILAPGALFNKRSAEIRREMIRRGCIEAIISLPPVAVSSRIPLVLLCLRAPDIQTGVGVLMIDASEISDRRSEEFVENIPNIANKVKAFRANPNTYSPDEQSIVVPILELMDGECSLIPTHHVLRARKSNMTQLAELRPLLDSLKSSAKSVGLISGENSIKEYELNHVRLKTMRNMGLAELIPGVRTEDEVLPFNNNDSLKEAEKQKVLTVKTLRTPGPLRSVEYIAKEKMQLSALTQTGDIILTRVGELQSKVDSIGGNLVLAPLSILRLDPQFDPYVVAASLNSDHVRKFTVGGGVGNIDLDILEIPQISIMEAEGLRKTLIQIEQVEEDVETLRQQLTIWRKIGGDYIATASVVTL